MQPGRLELDAFGDHRGSLLGVGRGDGSMELRHATGKANVEAARGHAMAGTLSADLKWWLEGRHT